LKYRGFCDISSRFQDIGNFLVFLHFLFDFNAVFNVDKNAFLGMGIFSCNYHKVLEVSRKLEAAS